MVPDVTHFWQSLHHSVHTHHIWWQSKGISFILYIYCLRKTGFILQQFKILNQYLKNSNYRTIFVVDMINPPVLMQGLFLLLELDISTQTLILTNVFKNVYLKPCIMFLRFFLWKREKHILLFCLSALWLIKKIICKERDWSKCI